MQLKRFLTHPNLLIRDLAKELIRNKLPYIIEETFDSNLFKITALKKEYNIIWGDSSGYFFPMEPGGFTLSHIIQTGKDVIKVIQKYEKAAEIIKILNTSRHHIYNIYPYGSRVYQTASNESDYDFLVVGNFGVSEGEFEVREENINIHFFPSNLFLKMLKSHQINALEAFFLPNNLVIQQSWVPEFTLDLSKLRKEISAKSSNSWVKCKKKLTVEKDAYYIGIKSLFHSLRILRFGIQIAKHKKIVDYTEANYLWKEIKEAGKQDWDYFKKKYQKLYNSFATEFRKLAPKD